MSSGEEQTLLLEDELLLQNENNGLHTGDGSVDINGMAVLKQKTGNWTACSFILGNECCERLAYYGIATNLVTYLTGKLHEGNVSAAKNVNIWAGTCCFTPLIGATLADAYWGRYWTIFVFSTIYFIGMCTLTLSATIPVLKPAECIGSLCPPATPVQYGVFFFGLYLIAFGAGGIKPCVSSFGADQFDATDPKERVKKGSFFNWFYFSINIGCLVSSSLMVYIQDKAGWGLGFGIPALFMGIAIAIFFSGTPLYEFCLVYVKRLESKFMLTYLFYLICQRSTGKKVSTDLCLDKAAIMSEAEIKGGDFSDPWRLCTMTQVEELKILICMFPIWATSIVFSAVHAQMSTIFVEQGMQMDKTIGSFNIPPASMITIDVISVIFWVPIYDRIIVPIARKFTGRERGFSELQRMGIGLFISMLSMTAAALLEIKRLQLVKELGLVGDAVAVPLSILWQIPQYMLIGTAEIFTYIGQLEFFYEQSPDAMRSLCSALSLLAASLGSYLSSFILSMVTYLTTTGGKTGWVPDNLNAGHLDYLFWLLAGLSFFNLLIYTVCAKRYKEKKAS
ncbi:protein NRT1/ PTR FAMILY 8.3-like [Populus alba x Populus x berolinensis]|uniref:Protein NRT1/ PTR FAMILY 8.3-like n=2 Tax=Populus TaxID=3689 RepID=A0A4U5NQU8_POPAL|nr:protein NRT1/ PTR FAMILY 8.3-like [Populus alba x Populus x berolinensis]TKR86209.1 protein NRT1/ PTR FAMILY 8.3-like [Populus alba]